MRYRWKVCLYYTRVLQVYLSLRLSLIKHTAYIDSLRSNLHHPSIATDDHENLIHVGFRVVVLAEP